MLRAIGTQDTFVILSMQFDLCMNQRVIIPVPTYVLVLFCSRKHAGMRRRNVKLLIGQQVLCHREAHTIAPDIALR